MIRLKNTQVVAYVNDISHIIGEIFVDDMTELPDKDGIDGYELVQGSVARVIHSGESYVMDSNGIWYNADNNSGNSGNTGDLGNVDLSNYYTKSQTNNLISGKVDKVSGKGLSTNDFTDEYKAKIDESAPQSTTYTKSETDQLIISKVAEIVSNAPEDFDTLKEIADWIESHEDSASAMNSAISANTTAINNKVDKISGKQLSTNDYTTAEKEKLAGLENYDDTEIRQSVDDLQTTKADKTDLETLRERVDNMSENSGGNDSTDLADRVNNLETELSGKVDKVNGKGLSTNDFTTAYKDKLESLQNYDDTKIKAEISENLSTLGYSRKNILENTAKSGYIDGITYTVNDDKTVTINGTATENLYININSEFIPSDKKFIMSGCPKGGSDSTYRLEMLAIYPQYVTFYAIDTGNGTIFDNSDKKISTEVSVRIYIEKNSVINNLTFKPMIRYADITDDNYESYKPSIIEKLDGLHEYDDTEIKSDISTINISLGNKVDKVSGKGLSTNDFTDEYKSKVDAMKSNLVGENVTGKSYTTIDGNEHIAKDGAEIFNDYTTNKAIGEYSHAEGQKTQATADCSHSEGNFTIASGYCSHAEWQNTSATDEFAHSEGYITRANGFCSHTEGRGTIANTDFSHVMGKYNAEDTKDKFAFIIGNGSGAGARSNAFAIDWQGNIYVGNSDTPVNVLDLMNRLSALEAKVK
ncbi:MAG: hypothetical protein K2L10_08185 [Ruminococcus sp.]|nr:hypothetical protein [Ruminococcus sp.]